LKPWKTIRAEAGSQEDDQFIDPRYFVVLEYVDRRGEVEGSPLFVDSFGCSCIEDSEEKTGFVDLSS